MAYTVVRTDAMSGTKQPADLINIMFYGEENPEAIENGAVVKLEGFVPGKRDVYKAVKAEANTPLAECAIVAGVEVMYDEHKKNLDEYTNEAGKVVRAYIPRQRNVFSVTVDGFESKTAPEVGNNIGLSASAPGKMTANHTGVGKCVAIEKTSRYTYYVIEIGDVMVAGV